MVWRPSLLSPGVPDADGNSVAEQWSRRNARYILRAPVDAVFTACPRAMPTLAGCVRVIARREDRRAGAGDVYRDPGANSTSVVS